MDRSPAGLFLEDDIADIASGEEFVPDHDQLVAAGGGVTWTPAARLNGLRHVQIRK